MWNFNNLEVPRWEHLDALQAIDDSVNALEVAEDHATPVRLGYVVRWRRPSGCSAPTARYCRA